MTDADITRKKYRELSDDEKEAVSLIKDQGANFIATIEGIENVSGGGAREYALARTKIEEAVMWAVKGITK